MDIYVYSDESGVFDKFHNDHFVFGGVLFFSQKEKEDRTHMYLSVERIVRKSEGFPLKAELKAAMVSKKAKNKLFRSLGQVEKFGVVVHQEKVLDGLFSEKKLKQRYLDYVFMRGIRHKFETMIAAGKLDPTQVHSIYFYVDEHSTATDGDYELEQVLEEEFEYGRYNFDFTEFFPPLFHNMRRVELRFCHSTTTTLIRAADIVANRLLYASNHNLTDTIENDRFPILHL